LTSVAGLVTAAGSGTRLGMGPKPFLELAGRSLLWHAVTRLASVCDTIVVAVPAGMEAEAQRSLAEAGDVTFVVGGATRQQSVLNMLDATSASHVVIHDSARPFTPRTVLEAVRDAALRDGAATAAMPVADTLHDVETDRPVPRDVLRAIQTPQAFATALLRDAHAVALRDGLEGTDDAQLVRALGHAVTLVPGSPWSHKLTRPGDLSWLEALAAAEPDA